MKAPTTKPVFMLLFSMFLVLVYPIAGFPDGDQKGNGGEIIACSMNGKTTYDILDLYEGRTLNHFTYSQPKGSSVSEIFEELVRRLDKLNPARANLYRDYMAHFESESVFVPNSAFESVGDNGGATYPKDCELKQIVVQYDRPTPEGLRYMINKDLWQELSNQQKAAMLLHEFIYREGRLPANDFRNSLGVRYFNAFLHSDIMDQLTLKKYLESLIYVGFRDAEAHSEPIRLFSWNKDRSKKARLEIRFHSENAVEYAKLSNKFLIPQVTAQGKLSECASPNGNEHSVWFTPKGSISTIHIGCRGLAFKFVTALGTGYVIGTTFSYNTNEQIQVVTSEADGISIGVDRFRYQAGKHYFFWQIEN